MITIPQSFKDSVNSLVEVQGKKGRAREALSNFYETVLEDWGRASAETQPMLRAQLDFLEGYMEGPAAVLADLKHLNRRRR